MAPSTQVHSACDECRNESQRFRKLKCSGEPSGCERCIEKNIPCAYSAQKTMGRPPKRRREDTGNPVAHSAENVTPDLGNDLSLLQGDQIPHFDERLPTNAVYDLDFDSFGLTSVSNGHIADGQMNSISYSDPSNGIDHPGTDSTLQAAPSMPCSCLPNMYLSLSNLQAAEDISFPFAMRPIRSAMKTGKEMIDCNHCPLAAISAQQNTLFLVTLLTTIALQVDRLLQNINTESQSATASGEKKTLILGDPSPENLHLHTGTPDCPGKFTVELEAGEWARITKGVVKRDVLGVQPNILTLENLVTELEQRQMSWHSKPCPHDSVLRSKGTSDQPLAEMAESNFNCLRMTKQVRHMMEKLPW